MLQKRHAWVFSMLEADPEKNNDYDVAEALPGYSASAQTKAVMDIKQWLKGLPLSRRQLCKVRTFIGDCLLWRIDGKCARQCAFATHHLSACLPIIAMRS